MQIESFASTPLQNIIKSYLYLQYNDDQDLQAFASTFNSIAQGYLDWFNANPLAVYVNPGISGTLLDWVANGIYGIPRPILVSGQTRHAAGYNDDPYNMTPYNGYYYLDNESSTIANDDIYKRCLTWNLYRGDGQVFCMQWLKNRINRFINGINGGDWPVLNNPPYITVSGTTFSVSIFDSYGAETLNQCFNNGDLAFPFLYTLDFTLDYFASDGGVLTLPVALTYPTSPVGLPDGSVWWNGGVICVVPGITPDPSAPPVYLSSIYPGDLLALGGGNLPLSNPGVGSGQLWDNGGVISIA